MRPLIRRALMVAPVLLLCAPSGAQPTAQEDEREAVSLVESLEAKIDSWERRPAERETLEEDIESDLDRLNRFYQARYLTLLGRRGYSWRSRRLLDRTQRTLYRAAGFGRGRRFGPSLAGALISFGGVLGQPGGLSLGRPRAAIASYSLAGGLLRGVRRGAPGFGHSSTLLTGLHDRTAAFGGFGWYQPGLYGFGGLPGGPGAANRPPEEPVRPPLPDHTLGELVDELLEQERPAIQESIASMPYPGAAPTLEESLDRYGFLEEKAGKMWAQVSELHYRLAAEGHRLQPETVKWTANLQVALEEAAAGLEGDDPALAARGVRRGEFELTRLAQVVGR